MRLDAPDVTGVCTDRAIGRERPHAGHVGNGFARPGFGLAIQRIHTGLRLHVVVVIGQQQVVVTAPQQTVDQGSVTTPADVQKRIDTAKANGFKVVTLLVYRQGDFQWVAVRTDQG